MTQVTYALKYGLVAQVLAGDDDRPPFNPPKGNYATKPSARAPHHPRCPCVECVPQPEPAR